MVSFVASQYCCLLLTVTFMLDCVFMHCTQYMQKQMQYFSCYFCDIYSIIFVMTFIWIFAVHHPELSVQYCDLGVCV